MDLVDFLADNQLSQALSPLKAYGSKTPQDVMALKDEDVDKMLAQDGTPLKKLVGKKLKLCLSEWRMDALDLAVTLPSKQAKAGPSSYTRGIEAADYVNKWYRCQLVGFSLSGMEGVNQYGLNNRQTTAIPVGGFRSTPSPTISTQSIPWRDFNLYALLDEHNISKTDAPSPLSADPLVSVIHKTLHLFLVHYEGWDPKWDEYLVLPTQVNRLRSQVSRSSSDAVGGSTSPPALIGPVPGLRVHVGQNLLNAKALAIMIDDSRPQHGLEMESWAGLELMLMVQYDSGGEEWLDLTKAETRSRLVDGHAFQYSSS